METGYERRIFSIGDPVVLVADRPLKGHVTAEDIPHVGVIDLAPQSFQGQKGWVFSLSRPAAGGEPEAYEVAFRVQGTPRAAVVHQFLEEAGMLSEERQLDRGRGCIQEVQPEDLTPDSAPEGTFDDLMNEMYEAGEFDLDPTEVLSEAESLLGAREAFVDPEGYAARRQERLSHLGLLDPPEVSQKFLEQDQAAWRDFSSRGWPSITEYIRRYIEVEDAGRLDWTPTLSAIEQAEQGDRTAFEALLESVYTEGREILSLGTGRPDPGVPTTACFDCDAIVPVADSWVSRRDHALCESCFQKREAKGRARRRHQPFARE